MTAQAICTIITKSHLCYARALAESVCAYNPQMPVYVLLADRVDGYFDPSQEFFELIYLEDLPDQNILQQMCFYYTPFEFCCALRGWLHEFLLDHTDLQEWLFLDADILVMHNLQEIFRLLKSHSILLNPHFQYWQKLRSGDELEQVVLRAGLYNGGFLGIRRCEESRLFTQWFKSRLSFFCFDDLAQEDLRGLFVDQRWLNLVPLYFPHAGFLTVPGANLAHWNLFEHTLNLHNNGMITVDSEPLLFVHFSGWDIEKPGKVSQYNFTSAVPDQSLAMWENVGNLYRDRLLYHGYATTRALPYAFSQFSTGESIQMAMRRIYYEDLMSADPPSGNPFEHASEFYDRTYPPGTSVRNLKIELANLQTELQQQQQQQPLLESVTSFQIQVQQSQQHIAQLQQQQHHLEQCLQQAETTITAMQSSKLWKLWQAWVYLKDKLKLWVRSMLLLPIDPNKW